MGNRNELVRELNVVFETPRGGAIELLHTGEN